MLVSSRILLNLCSFSSLRFKPRNPGSPTDNDVICTGGDNSYGLIITEPSGEQQQISVNDSLIGRRSKPFIAKVWTCCELLVIVKSVY